ncbi:metal ABC transporter ATP-binding protein [Candidatus Dojkabacteria bacterium]|nr:metal ABC transporter ATP-binding protein [Candidatus Dojkabacteria bacterium]
MDKKNFAIETTNLTVSINGNSILNSVNLSIDTGGFVFVVGPNGSGKSTLVKAIMGLIDIDGGEVKVFGEKNTQKNIASNIGYVPQYVGLDREFPITVEEMINLECEDKGKCHKEIGEHFEYLDSHYLLKRKINQLSGGEMQKVLIVRGLVKNPEILILDEPTSNLDTASHRDLYLLLENLNERGKTIIFISHDLNVVNKFASKVLYLYEHEVVTGDRESILSQYRDLFDNRSDSNIHGSNHINYKNHKNTDG